MVLLSQNENILKIVDILSDKNNVSYQKRLEEAKKEIENQLQLLSLDKNNIQGEKCILEFLYNLGIKRVTQDRYDRDSSIELTKRGDKFSIGCTSSPFWRGLYIKVEEGKNIKIEDMTLIHTSDNKLYIPSDVQKNVLQSVLDRLEKNILYEEDLQSGSYYKDDYVTYGIYLLSPSLVLFRSTRDKKSEYMIIRRKQISFCILPEINEFIITLDKDMKIRYPLKKNEYGIYTASHLDKFMNLIHQDENDTL